METSKYLASKFDKWWKNECMYQKIARFENFIVEGDFAVSQWKDFSIEAVRDNLARWHNAPV